MEPSDRRKHCPLAITKAPGRRCNCALVKRNGKRDCARPGWAIQQDANVAEPKTIVVIGAGIVGTFDRLEPANSAKALVKKLQNLFGAPQLVLENYVIGFRPTPLDGFPAIGPVQGFAGLYVVVSHSGVTLALALGEMAADEIMYGERHPLLAPCRFDRFVNMPPS